MNPVLPETTPPNVTAYVSAQTDSDGKSNIIELQNNTDPTNPGGKAATDVVDDLVAVYFAEYGAFASPDLNPNDLMASADYDSDGASNLAKIFFEYDPASHK